MIQDQPSGVAIPSTEVVSQVASGANVQNVLCKDFSVRLMSELPRWQELDSLLPTYSHTTPKVVVRDQNRRWELVSTYQKSIRRADAQMALKIVSAFDSIPEHRPYLWRRLLTTVAEDVGPADPVLVGFALYCSVEFRNAPAQDQQRLLAFLTAYSGPR